MLFKPLLGTDLSGKVGGIVASHNAGGAYFRAATIPTNPNTPQQQAVRNAVSALSVKWNDGLTATQRTEWDVYASNVTLTNRIGEQHNVSGMAMYVRSNVPRLQTGLTSIDDGPGIFSLGNFTAPFLTAFSEATQQGNFHFSVGGTSDPWANEVGGFLFLRLSRPQNASINFFRGPYRQTDRVTGDPVPPVSPIIVTAPFPFIEGAKIFGQATAMRADARYTTHAFFETTAIA